MTDLKGPPPPAAVALMAYTQMCEEIAKMDKLSPDEISAKMKEAVIGAIECACRAQRAADALLIEVIGDNQPALADRKVCAELAAVLKGEKKPNLIIGH